MSGNVSLVSSAASLTNKFRAGNQLEQCFVSHVGRTGGRDQKSPQLLSSAQQSPPGSLHQVYNTIIHLTLRLCQTTPSPQARRQPNSRRRLPSDRQAGPRDCMYNVGITATQPACLQAKTDRSCPIVPGVGQPYSSVRRPPGWVTAPVATVVPSSFSAQPSPASRPLRSGPAAAAAYSLTSPPPFPFFSAFLLPFPPPLPPLQVHTSRPTTSPPHPSSHSPPSTPSPPPSSASTPSPTRPTPASASNPPRSGPQSYPAASEAYSTPTTALALLHTKKGHAGTTHNLSASLTTNPLASSFSTSSFRLSSSSLMCSSVLLSTIISERPLPSVPGTMVVRRSNDWRMLPRRFCSVHRCVSR
jgi:hypothetical protein